MDRYKDRFNNNFTHKRVEVGSRNHITMRDMAGSPAFTLLVGFAILLIVAVIIYLWIAWDMLLQSLILLLVFGSVLLLIWHGLMSAIRSAARTHAAVTYYGAQRKRNKVLSDGPGLVIMEDPYEELRAVNARAIQVQRRYDHSNVSGVSAISAAGSSEQKDIDFENIIKWGGSRADEYEEEEGEYYEADQG